jgi:pimeloyl-ACP methyl ester carboxylesterase
MPSCHPFRSESAKKRYLSVYDAKAERWPVSSECRVGDTSWGQTFVRISGPEDGPPLVLLPGAASTSLMWIPAIRSLSEGFRTYAVDNVYDYGRSVWTCAIRGPDDFTAWLDELFDALGLGDSINLLGISYGGWLACTYALRFPQRLDKVVTLAPAGTVIPVGLAFMLRAALTFLPYRYFTKSFLYWLFGDSTGHSTLNPSFLDDAVDEMFVASRCFKRKRFISPRVLTDTQLKGITTPMLYLIGEKDRICSARKTLTRLNRVAPHIETEIIPLVGHGLSMEESGTVNKKIIKFLERDRPRTNLHP